MNNHIKKENLFSLLKRDLENADAAAAVAVAACTLKRSKDAVT